MNSIFKYILPLMVLSILVANDKADFVLLEKSPDKATIVFANEEVKTEKNGIYDKFLNYQTVTLDDGLPELPKYTLNYGLNPLKEYRVNYNIVSSHIIQDIDVYPHQTAARTELNKSDELYINTISIESNNVFPLEVIQEQRATLRGNDILSVDVIPFIFNSSTKSLEVIDEIEIVIEEVGDRPYLDATSKRSKTFQNIYNNLVLDTFDNREIDFQEPSILYICGGSSIDYSYLEYLIEWRRKQGYQVTAVDLTEVGGNSTTYIKNYIQDAYDNWENPPEFITLIGDASGSGSVPTVPTYNVGEGGGWNTVFAEADLPYVLLEGDDFLADATIGRISVRSETEFSVVASKIIGYEKLYAGPDWIESVALVGDPSDSGISTVITNEYIAQIMDNYGMEDINEQYTGNGSFDDFMRNQMNAGVSYLNYRGFYGFSNFNDSDVNQLSNGFKLPFLTTLTCDTGSFSSDVSCISESLLRAGTSVNNPRGAVAVVATAQPYTHTAFNNIVAMGMYSGIFLYGAKTAGESLAYGELALSLAYPQNPNNNVYYFAAWNNLMGDAATMLWTDTPRVLIADHQENVSMGTDDIIDITVIDENGYPVEGANVNLNFGDIYVNAITRVDGHAIIELDDFTDISGTIDVTVTCQDCLYSETSFLLNQDTLLPEVLNASILIDEINTFSNSDGQVNPGEEVSIDFYINNYTGELLEDISVSIESSVLSISSENSISISSMGIGEAALVEGLVVSIPADILPDTEPVFYANISGNNSSLESNQLLDLPIYSGSVSLLAEGAFEPGSSSSLSIEIYNSGEIDFSQLTGEILNNDSDLFFETEAITWTEVGVDATSQSTSMQLSTDNGIINGSVYNIPVRITDDFTFEQVVNLQLTVGDVSIGDPLGPDPYGYYIYGEEDTDYDLAPTYSWVEIAPSQGGDGYQLDLNDNGNNQDDVTTIDLPFTFTFYGEDYDRVSVCSNGWIAFGESDLESFRNYPIPGTGGPSPMVAVFWDDLEDGDAYAYYDQGNDRFIIEWYNYDTYYANSNEEFQVILYNTGSETPTGDDEILLQYRDFSNTSVGSYPIGNYDGAVVHGQYTSVGIEDHTGLVGLEYTFNNQYPEPAGALSDQSALFITTRTSSLYAEPEIQISSNSLDYSIEPNESTSDIFSITNSGEPESNLNYTLTVSPFVNQQSIVDEGGYAWSSSDSDEYVSYDWIDISDDNVTISFDSNDASPGYFDIGFDFPFYGDEYNQLLINPNGWVGFGEDNSEWDNESVFDGNSPKNAILAYWDDLNPISGDNEVGEGSVRFQSNSDRMVIWYDDVIHWTNDDIRHDFQIILFPSGAISVNYRSIEGVSNDGATIGIINADGDVGQEVPYDNLDLSNELSLSYKLSPEWVSLSQYNGNVNYQESDDIIINIDMDGYDSGSYIAYMILESNAAANIIIPITSDVNSYLSGDLNADGGIDILDVVRLVAMILNNDGSSYEEIVADLNGDSDVNIMDVILLVQIILN